MASYAGAVQAIRDRLVANWTTTPIAHQNKDFEPPLDDDSNPAPWVALEVIGNGSELRTAGKPGAHDWLYRGHILVHVFVPVNGGAEDAFEYASTIGEIFRAAAFYRDDDAGALIRSWAPQTDGGGISDDKGLWFRVTMTCPFDFYFRG
jgi:hypothetical protein